VADYVYAAVWQLRGLVDRSDPAHFADGERTPIVVVPGIWESWRFLRPLISRMHDEGHPVFVVNLLGFNGRPVSDAAAVVDAYLRTLDVDEVILVAHSKGGLVGKYVMVHGVASAKIRAMLAVSAPFNGSAYARWLVVPSLRLLAPRDPLIVALAADLAVNARIVSVYPRFDPHIPGGSFLPGAKNVRLDTGGHFRVLADPRVIAELAVLATAPPGEPPSGADS